MMKVGDPHEAAAAGHKALDDAASLRSRRAADDLRELQGFAAAHREIAEVSMLIERVEGMLVASTA
jgi:hypothetical protein